MKPRLPIFITHIHNFEHSIFLVNRNIGNPLKIRTIKTNISELKKLLILLESTNRHYLKIYQTLFKSWNHLDGNFFGKKYLGQVFYSLYRRCHKE